MGRAECVDCGAVLREMLVENRSVMVCPWLRGKMTSQPVQHCGWAMNRPREHLVRRDG